MGSSLHWGPDGEPGGEGGGLILPGTLRDR